MAVWAWLVFLFCVVGGCGCGVGGALCLWADALKLDMFVRGTAGREVFTIGKGCKSLVWCLHSSLAKP